MKRPLVRRWRGPAALVALVASSAAFGGLALPLLARDASPEALTARPAKTVRLVRAENRHACRKHAAARPMPLLGPRDR